MSQSATISQRATPTPAGVLGTRERSLKRVARPARRPPACLRCRSESYTILFRAANPLGGATQERFHIVECSHCSLIRLDPMPLPRQGRNLEPTARPQQAKEFGQGPLGRCCQQFLLSDRVRFVTRAAQGRGPILDIGCGDGALVQTLRRRGLAAIGLDRSAEALPSGRASNGRAKVQAESTLLPFRKRSFRVVTMFGILEHVPDPLTSLLAVRELLIPGGKVIVQAPNAASWQFLLLGERWSALNVPWHLTHFKLEDLEGLLGMLGFEVTRRKFFTLSENAAMLAASLCPDLEPAARCLRAATESRLTRFLKDALYVAVAAAVLPLTLLEAVGGAGASVMVEAVYSGSR